jgi:hypothetical protein
VASTQKIIDTGAAIKDYIATFTPEQVGNDIKGFVAKNWDSLKASHAAAAAQGPAGRRALVGPDYWPHDI